MKYVLSMHSFKGHCHLAEHIKNIIFFNVNIFITVFDLFLFINYHITETISIYKFHYDTKVIFCYESVIALATVCISSNG